MCKYEYVLSPNQSQRFYIWEHRWGDKTSLVARILFKLCDVEPTFFINISKRRSTILHFFQCSFHGPCIITNSSEYYKHLMKKYPYSNWSSCGTVIGHLAIWTVTTQNSLSNKWKCRYKWLVRVKMHNYIQHNYLPEEGYNLTRNY